MRVILPLYYRGCPENIYTIQPDTAFCIVWSSIFAIQIITLYIQKLCGPRFFIPKKFIPGHF
jgi:ABC-type Mn2+/Zn2+ transport system permease subunit